MNIPNRASRHQASRWSRFVCESRHHWTSGLSLGRSPNDAGDGGRGGFAPATVAFFASPARAQDATQTTIASAGKIQKQFLKWIEFTMHRPVI
jgi:hypothetical protein